MENLPNNTAIKFRVNQARKNHWKSICTEREISLTSLIISSVENRIQDNERRKILQFIEKQDNVFVKIETNINQLAKIANVQKHLTSSELETFSNKLTIIIELKKKQNEIFKQIYSMLGK